MHTEPYMERDRSPACIILLQAWTLDCDFWYLPKTYVWLEKKARCVRQVFIGWD